MARQACPWFVRVVRPRPDLFLTPSTPAHAGGQPAGPGGADRAQRARGGEEERVFATSPPLASRSIQRCCFAPCGPQVDSEDLGLALGQWQWVLAGAGGGAEGQRWQQPWAMQALAALQRMELTLAAHMDGIYNMVGAPAVVVLLGLSRRGSASASSHALCPPPLAWSCRCSRTPRPLAPSARSTPSSSPRSVRAAVVVGVGASVVPGRHTVNNAAPTHQRTRAGEEVVRGQSLFCLSPMLKALEPMLRSAAGVAPWQVRPRFWCCSSKPSLPPCLSPYPLPPTPPWWRRW